MKFEPTHELTTEDGKAIMVKLVDTAAYQAHEWIESMVADITYEGSWKRNGSPMIVSAKEVKYKMEPDDFR